MRIQTIELTNYKAFLGTYSINVAGKIRWFEGIQHVSRHALNAMKSKLGTGFNCRDLCTIMQVNAKRAYRRLPVSPCFYWCRRSESN